MNEQVPRSLIFHTTISIQESQQLHLSPSQTTMSSRNSSASSYPSRSSKSHDDLVNEVVATSLGTDKQSAILIKYILMAIGALAVLKILSQSLLYLSIAASPFLYAYLKGTCPSTNTFDAKEELKPVLEGRFLPPQQQATKSSWEKMLNSARASVTAEYSALMGDFRTEFTPIFGVAVLAKVTCQQQTYYWIGARNEWKFLYTNGIYVSPTTMSTNRRASSISTSSNNETFRESMTRKSTIAAAAAVAALSSSTATRADDSKKSL
ncbi:hypothetical protein IV203_035045 [Nitzschia inconspicua]|uniref:Uncharacterized protein n=1 Tax=Nitzschia inconspicua TaxID=303405 RepID=A0A9K3LDB4_9STRA|nr:hypothetical protein IV203_035045 [Nitzschia inconspicua]